MSLEQLLERVEAASGPDRDLDFETDVALALPGHAAHWEGQRVRIYVGIPHNEYNEDHPNHRKKGSKDEIPSPPYTSSLDAAVTLVEEKLPRDWSLGFDWGQTGTIAHAWVGWKFSEHSHEGHGRTPALALLAALLRAMIAEGQS